MLHIVVNVGFVRLFIYLFLSLSVGGVVLSKAFFPPFSEAKRDLIAPPRGVEHFAFGYQESLADLFWIRAIQDFDYCEEKLAVVASGSSNSGSTESEAFECRGKGWLYKMLDTITELSPKFLVVYRTGGLALTVLISDYAGASLFFDKSVSRFPKDWMILYRASYHYLYEEKNKKKAAHYLLEAARNGAPSWVYNLAGRLYSDEGYGDLAQSVLDEMIKAGESDLLIERLRKKIAEIKSSR